MRVNVGVFVRACVACGVLAVGVVLVTADHLPALAGAGLGLVGAGGGGGGSF